MASGAHAAAKKSGGKAPLIIAAVIAAVIVAAAALGTVFFTIAGGRLLPRNAENVELGGGKANVSALLRLKNPKYMDLRGSELRGEDYFTLADAFPNCEIVWDVPLGGVGEVYDSLSESVAVPVYHSDKAELYAAMPNLKEIDLRDAIVTVADFEALRAAVPNCRIIWNVPVGTESFDSTSESIALSEFTPTDAENLVYFENLKTLDTLEGDAYEAYMAAEEILPHCDVRWSIALGGERLDPDAAVLELADAPVTVQELTDALGLFPNAKVAVLGNTALSREDLLQLREDFPGLSFEFNVEMGEYCFYSLGDKLDFAGLPDVDVEILFDAAWIFVALEEIDLRETGLSVEELMAIAEAYPGASIRADVELYGKSFPTDAEEIDLSGIEITDTSLIEKALPLFPKLKKVIMSDCGISDEDMDALNLRHEDVEFVWTVRFSVYSVRTDVTAFCASNVPGYVAPKLTDSQLAPIKYLRNLEALDLGHMYYTDLSFLENMPNLRYLILVEANFRDISAIAGLENLYYLEIFNNTINDISPLLECKSLRHLNIGFTRGYEADCLREMTWLERLWYPGSNLSGGQIEDLQKALADTETYFVIWDGDGSTGGGWREHDSYYEMRDLFNMHYMPGGTGVPGAEE